MFLRDADRETLWHLWHSRVSDVSLQNRVSSVGARATKYCLPRRSRKTAGCVRVANEAGQPQEIRAFVFHNTKFWKGEYSHWNQTLLNALSAQSIQREIDRD